MNKCVTLTLTTTTLTLTLPTTILTLNAHAGALFLGVRYHRGGISDALCVEWRRTRTPFAVALNTESPWRRFLMNSEWECFAPHKQQWWPYWLLLSIKRNTLVVRTCFMVRTSILVAFLHTQQITSFFKIIDWSVGGDFMQLLRTRLGWQHKSPWWHSDAKTEPLLCHSIPWLWVQHTLLTH